MRARGIGLATFVIALASGTARAGGAAPAGPVAPAAAPATTFDSLAAGATRLSRVELAGWAWSMTAPCSDGDELAQRQCRVVRDARRAALADQVFVVDAGPDAFQAGAWDPAKKSVSLIVRGCVACTALDVGGKKLFVVSDKAAPTDAGASVQAAVINETARVFDSEAAASEWKAKAVPRLQVELIFRLPAGPATWSRGGKDGLAVNVLAFRVVDPCDGGVVCSSGGAAKLDPDRKSCGTVEEGATAAPDDTAAAPTEQVVDRLESWMIQKALAPALVEVQKCHDTYGVDGATKIKLAIAADGSITTFDQHGDFDDTPTGACIAKAIKPITFPKAHKATTVSYPIVLR